MDAVAIRRLKWSLFVGGLAFIAFQLLLNFNKEFSQPFSFPKLAVAVGVLVVVSGAVYGVLTAINFPLPPGEG